MAVDNGPVTCSNLSVNQVGPYSQTLALGCSVTNMSMNVGWGSTSSTCGLTLVRDFCRHWRDQEAYAESNTFWESLLQQGPDNPLGNPLPKQQDSNTIDPSQLDPRRTWQRNIAQQQVAEQNYKLNNQDSNQIYGDFGKQMWYSNLAGGFSMVNWLGPDPGFLANANNAATQINNPDAGVGYDVNGTCVFVKMEDLFFGGIIKNWENKAGTQGVTTSVNLDSMSSLLKGVNLIINNYNGSVGTRYASLFNDVPIVTIPSNDVGGDYREAESATEIYNGSVRGGNHPNLINLQGLANFVYGFSGASWAGTKGVSAADIYFLLNSILNPANLTLPTSPYFPYGAMVGRSLVNRFTGEIVNTTQQILSYGNSAISYEALGWMPTKLAIDNRFRPLFSLDLSEVPAPPSDLYFTESNLTITSFLDTISQGGQYDYIVDCVPSTNPLYSACIKIRTVNRSLAVPPNTLLNSLSARDDFQNLTYGEEFDTASVRQVTLGAPQQRLMQFTTIGKSMFQEQRVYDPFGPRDQVLVTPYGENMITEYDDDPNDSEPPTNVQQGQNAFQENMIDVRWYKSYRVGAGIVAQSTTTQQFFTDYNNGTQGVKKLGNYGFRQFVRMPSGVDQEKNSYPLCSDLISPYYGQDSTKNIRLVYFDRKMGQIQVMTSVLDWRLWCSYETPDFAEPTAQNTDGETGGQGGEVIGDDETGEFTVFKVAGAQWIITETEIRAAMSGIDVFFSYLYDNYKCGFVSMTAKYFYDYISQAFCKSVADQLLGGSTYLEYIQGIDGSKVGYPNADGIHDAKGWQGQGITNGVIVPAVTDYRVFLELKKLMKFIADDIGQYHAKSYLIRMPQVYSFIDRTGQRQYNYEPATFAWEEEGNPLDDTMVIGSNAASVLSNDNGTFGPIIGFLGNLEYDRQNKVFKEDDITHMPLPIECPQKPENGGGEEDDGEEIGLENEPDGSKPPNQPKRDEEVDLNDNPDVEPQGMTGADGVSPPRETLVQMRGWYQPLNLEKLDKSTSIYFTSVTLNDDRNNFYASLGFPVNQNRPFYNTPQDTHGFATRNNNSYRKIYVKGKFEVLNDRAKMSKQLGFSRMHGGSPCTVISIPAAVDQSHENGLRFTLAVQKYLYNYLGFQLPKESGFERNWEPGKLQKATKKGVPPNVEITYETADPDDFKDELTYARNARRLLVSGQVGSNATNESDNRVFKIGLFAIPVFAAVPVKYNTANYGPWASVPGLVETEVFNDANPVFNATLADNMVGGINVKYDNNAAPWNFGGVEYLDYAKLTEVTENLKGQQSLEKASFAVPGILLSDGFPVSIGSFVAGRGAIVNSLSTSISAQGGFSTNYTLRTYAKKIGFYNNERAKEIAELGKQNNEIRNELRRLERENFDNSLTQPNTTRGSQGGTNVTNETGPANNDGLIGETSPVEAMCGTARPYIPNGASFADEVNYDPSWHVRQSTAGATTGPDDTYQHLSRTFVYKEDEFVTKMITPEVYGSYSMMSLDGIVSPISFYPTPYGATYHITRYDRKHCPYCKGTGKYKFQTSGSTASTKLFFSFDEIDSKSKTLTVNCKFCTTDKEQERSGSAGKTTIRTPPYIIDKGTDAELAEDATNVEEDACQDSRVLINYTTLTPVVMSSTSGEFAVSVNRQEGDLCAHSIRMVGVGWQPPSGSESIYLYGTANRTKNYSDYDVSYDNGSTGEDFEALNNARFMGLRGPMMLHGWGYDVDGYPVPNASGDIQYGDDGAPITDENGNAVYANQVQMADGSYSAPFPEQKFAKNWASAPNTWPVGPIDLRWNPKAKLWTVGTSYTDVYVTLENDLKGDTPVRAVLTDAADNTDPLPDGYRKLVFVQDPNGFFSAPRGATIYAKYNTDSGFYNPIFNNTTIVLGVVNSAGAATVYIDEKEYDVGFSNPLEIGVNIGAKAIFMFVNGEWIVQATSCR